MKYFFILGNHPTLSVAEISAVFGLTNKKNDGGCACCAAPGANIGYIVSPEVFVVETAEEVDAGSLMNRLGGTVKFGRIEAKADRGGKELEKEIFSRLEPGRGKFNFGLSYYGRTRPDLKKIGLRIKARLKDKGVSCRLVEGRGGALSSVAVEQNRLTRDGAEIVLIELGRKLFLARTEAVQPFKSLSYRDYGRPERDDHSGMLPPKLAQIMINLATNGSCSGQNLLDPFCGSGTILAEAALMGCAGLTGTDISDKAVADTRKNLSWIARKFDLSGATFNIFKADAAKLSSRINSGTIDCVVTEPYLGPQRGRIDAKKITAELNKLYSRALAEIREVLKPEGRAVMVWPVFNIDKKSFHLNPDTLDLKITNPLPQALRAHRAIKLTDRQTVIYGRRGQRITREIITLSINQL